MLGTLQDSSYYFLCNLSKKITDYQTQSVVAEPENVGDIDEYGVNVEFDESGSEDEERKTDELVESEFWSKIDPEPPPIWMSHLTQAVEGTTSFKFR